MPHPRAKVRTQMPLPWDVLDKQMPRGGPGGGMGTLGFDSCIMFEWFQSEREGENYACEKAG